MFVVVQYPTRTKMPLTASCVHSPSPCIQPSNPRSRHSHSLPLSLHRRHRQNLAPLLALQLSTDCAVDTRSDRVARLVEKDTGIVVELDDRAVSALRRISGSDDDGVADVTALDLVGGRDTSHATGGRASLLLNDGDDTVTC